MKKEDKKIARNFKVKPDQIGTEQCQRQDHNINDQYDEKFFIKKPEFHLSAQSSISYAVQLDGS